MKGDKLTILILILLGAGAIASFFLFRKKDKKSSELDKESTLYVNGDVVSNNAKSIYKNDPFRRPNEGISEWIIRRNREGWEL